MTTKDAVIEMKELTERLLERWCEFKEDVEVLMAARRVILGAADPPKDSGVYIVYDHRGELSYVGKALGSGGIGDRLLYKHLSGDESHVIQRAYKDIYPDRVERRDFVKLHLLVSWIVVEDDDRSIDMERLLIWLLKPEWNRQ